MLTVKKLAYELYKIDWLARITPEQMKSTYKKYYEFINGEELEDYTFDEYLEEYGYDGEIYVCYEEFTRSEYLDKAFIKGLLNDENLYRKYLEDIGEKPEKENHCYFTGFLPRYIMLFAKPGTKDVYSQTFAECIESGVGEATYFATTMKKLVKLWEQKFKDHEGRWYWIFVDEECICSGMMDSGDKDVLEQYAKGEKNKCT